MLDSVLMLVFMLMLMLMFALIRCVFPFHFDVFDGGLSLGCAVMKFFSFSIRKCLPCR